MSYSLSAYGHAEDPEQEKILATSIGQVLANAGLIVSSASFSGSGFTGDPRTLGTPITIVDGEQL